MPSRGPVFNGAAALLLYLGGTAEYWAYQVIAIAHNTLMCLPLSMLLVTIAGVSRRTALPVAAAVCMLVPFFFWNNTFSWTKDLTAAFVLMAIYCYLEAYRQDHREGMAMALAWLAAGLSYALPGAGLRRRAWAASAEHFLEESASTGASSSGSRVGCLDRPVVRVHDAELWRPANPSREHHSLREGCAGTPDPAAPRADYESVCRPASLQAWCALLFTVLARRLARLPRWALALLATVMILEFGSSNWQDIRGKRLCYRWPMSGERGSEIRRSGLCCRLHRATHGL